jgi:uncharacterized protein (TIGR02996 family)
MTQADSLLEGILDDPEDEARRLVLADWLEEQGDPLNAARAELLRLQCARNRLVGQDEARLELRWRAAELLEAHPGLAGPLARLTPLTVLDTVLETGLALVAFLGAAVTTAAEDGVVAGSVWQGQLCQRKLGLLPLRIRVRWTVRQRQGNTFAGDMEQTLRLLLATVAKGRLFFTGAVLCGRLLAFVTHRAEGPMMLPGLYLARRQGDSLEGTWRVPRYRDEGTFQLSRGSEDSTPGY